MKHNSPFILLYVCLPLLLSSCNWFAETISFKFCSFDNNSDTTYFYIALSTDYPDTLYHWEDGYWIRCNLFYRGQDISFADPPEHYFEKNKVLQLFLFYDDRVWNYEDSAKWSKQFLRRYEFTREWMEEHDWTITYP